MKEVKWEGATRYGQLAQRRISEQASQKGETGAQPPSRPSLPLQRFQESAIMRSCCKEGDPLCFARVRVAI